MAKKLKIYIVNPMTGQRVRVDRKNEGISMMLLSNASHWQEHWFKKNRDLIDKAKRKNRPIRPGDMLPVYHALPNKAFIRVKMELGIYRKGSFRLWFDFSNVKGLVNMVIIHSEAFPAEEPKNFLSPVVKKRSWWARFIQTLKRAIPWRMRFASMRDVESQPQKDAESATPAG